MIGKMLHKEEWEKCCISKGSREARKVLQLFPSFKLGNSISSASKLLFKYEHFFFMKTANLIKKMGPPPLFYKHTVPANKIWNQWDFKNPNV